MTAADRYEAEHMTPPRPEPVATLRVSVAKLIEIATTEGANGLERALAKALEDTAAERDRAHATLEQIVSEAENHADAVHLARERLENP